MNVGDWNFNYDSDVWMTFFKDNWILLLVALIVLFIIVRIVNTVVKWLIAAVIVIGIVAYSGYTLQDLKDIGSKVTDIGGKVADSVKQEAISAMAGEAKDAAYTDNGDGTYTIKTRNLELSGKTGDTKVKVSYRGTSLGNWEIDDTIRTLIDQAKRNG
ncbi:hypothetical protein [Paenibacillus humicola]|uniref:hypothetical protein n=1 Tax=Paenibacillus humicola TaxID=3110540 RepID=UPI00237BFEE7|nr:hypothetical protein [Paenibacillus humicola]